MNWKQALGEESFDCNVLVLEMFLLWKLTIQKLYLAIVINVGECVTRPCKNVIDKLVSCCFETINRKLHNFSLACLIKSQNQEEWKQICCRCQKHLLACHVTWCFRLSVINFPTEYFEATSNSISTCALLKTTQKFMSSDPEILQREFYIRKEFFKPDLSTHFFLTSRLRSKYTRQIYFV